MPKIFPVAIFISVLVVISQFARTTPEGYHGTEATTHSTTHHQNQFRLKQSYPIGNESDGLLATIYSCGAGEKEKEILSVWSREPEAYELQYIKTAAAGQTFLKPSIFSKKEKVFIKIITRDRRTGHASTDVVLSLAPDSSVTQASRLH